MGEVTQMEIDALCDRMYRHAIARCQTEEQRAEQKKVTANQLVSWKILSLFDGKYFPTNAWKLLTDPAELFPEAIIQMAVFKGTTRAVFLDRKTAAGPVDEQIEEAMLFVKRNIRLGSRIAGVYREDIYLYADAPEHLADSLLNRHRVRIKFKGELESAKENYRIIFCKVRKKDEQAFLAAMDELPNKMLLLGRLDYEEFCRRVIGFLEEKREERRQNRRPLPTPQPG